MLIKLFKRDWELIEQGYGQWTGDSDSRCYYSLFECKLTGRRKVVGSGYKYKKHSQWACAVNWKRQANVS